MNKTAIKNFAVWARVQLIEAVKQKAFEYGIKEVDGQLSTDNCPLSTDDCPLSTDNYPLSTTIESEQRKALLARIDAIGYAQTMEEAAYTWFNRFIALRFMEVNGYLPSKVRVFTDETGAFKPEILKQAISVEIDGLDREKVLDLLDKQDNEELYKYLIITQCNALNAGLPYMFEKIANWTELLFPNNLLRPDSVLGQMISSIPEEDWTDAVQIIGWLYQYYNSELKDETFALLKKNVKITKERIPAATQLFTPDWIVRYMVENSLGRLWYEGHNDFDKSQWKYYLDEAKQEPEVEEQLKKIRAEYAAIRPEEIKVIDPCMGSGHILVYAFDVLMQIYTSAGWSERDAARSIIENNLYGLDIDDRAGQLAYFAVMMKARKYNRRILNGEVKTNVMSIQDSNRMTDEFIDYVAGKDADMKADLVMLRKTFRDAKEYGSILNVPSMQYDALYERMDIINRSYAEDLFQAQYRTMTVEHLLPLVKQSQIMSRQYDVVVTNPPYMGINNMGGGFYDHITERFDAFKHDLYCVFIEVCHSYIKPKRFQAMITQQSFMFNSRYEKAREQIVAKNSVITFIHLGARAFEEIGGEVVQTASFVFFSSQITGMRGKFVNLQDYISQDSKEQAYLSCQKENDNSIVFIKSLNDFSAIQGLNFSYWLSPAFLDSLQSKKRLGNIAETRHGLVTGNGELFMRLWFEVSITRFNCSTKNRELTKTANVWFPYNKGGYLRRWYGNREYVVNWERNGSAIRNYIVAGRLKSSNYNLEYNCKPNISWTDISTGLFSARYTPEGALFDTSGPSLFVTHEEDTVGLLGFMNTKVMQKYLEIYCVGLHYSTGAVSSIPILYNDSSDIDALVDDSVALSRTDYDSFETSWDFKKHPLV